MNSYPDVFNQKKMKIVNQQSIDNNNLTALHTTPYIVRQNIIQDNSVPREHFKHTWSNQRGHGNIVFGKNSNINKSKINVQPYNRINKIGSPYSSNVDTKMAWN